MSTRRGNVDDFGRRADRGAAAVERRLAGARVHKVSVWPPAWMAAPEPPQNERQENFLTKWLPGSSKKNRQNKGEERQSSSTESKSALDPDDATVELANVSILTSSPTPPERSLAISNRFGRMPKRAAEVLLAGVISVGVFGFALLSIANHPWPRTEVAGSIDDDFDPGRAAPRGGTIDGPRFKQRSDQQPDPLWPTPPPGRNQPPAIEPTVQPKRVMIDR